MQQEFARHFPSLKIQIVGINEIRQDSGNADMTNGRNLPWLQDVDVNPSNGVSDVWYDSWNVEYRDVIVVDRAGNEVGRYNLTSNSLGVETNYATMRQMFVDSAKNPAKTPWQCPVEPLDVTFDGRVELSDALQIINVAQLRTYPGGKLPDLNGATPSNYFDVTGDMNVTLQDAIQIINHLALVFTPTSALSTTVSSDPALATMDSADAAAAVNLDAGAHLQSPLARQVDAEPIQVSAQPVSALQPVVQLASPAQLRQPINLQRVAMPTQHDTAIDRDDPSYANRVDELFAQGW